MNLAGFEFEFLSLFEDYEIEKDLRIILGRSISKQCTVTTDASIKRDKQTKYSDGWSGWELITPPLPEDEALDVLSKIQNYLISTGIVTNKSCGFHVNISNENMNSFDPMTLISLVDEYKFAKTYKREDNPYCVPWSYYFEEIWKRIKRDTKLKLDKIQTFRYNAHSLVDSTSKGEYVDDNLELKYASNVTKFFDEKYLTTNVSKLTTKCPYIEFRMMGGTDYHQTALAPLVKELSDCVTIAANGFNRRLITEYFEQYYK
jgi:hypothetical protein